MPSTDLLKTFGLSRNPFTDRTAEKTDLDATSQYVHSDLRGFRPNDTTYVFFGRRGSGKTTIRLQMQEAYRQYNEAQIQSGKSKGHFMVDLCRPGHMTACLSNFQEAMKCGIESWDSVFSENWTTADLVDCILSYAATDLVKKLTTPGEESQAVFDKLKSSDKYRRQALLLFHLYARTDISTLAYIRSKLHKPAFTPLEVTIGVGAASTALGGVAWALNKPAVRDCIDDYSSFVWDKTTDALPILRSYPKLILGSMAGLGAGGVALYLRQRRAFTYARAAELQSNIRVVKAQPTELIASLISSYFSTQDSVDVIRGMCIGISAHQKMDLLSQLLEPLGYDSVTVFGDCFDEVTLLDPVRFPGAIKVFAREVCRNDVLNFGRMRFFFPDSRLALDLSTDKTLKEARFDRHFVRDLTWSRHQLEELAERRFRAAQKALSDETHVSGGSEPSFDTVNMSFADLFKMVRGEDFSSYIAKLSTPRELLIMMTEMFARIEAHPDGGLTAQDMEIAVTKALEQSV